MRIFELDLESFVRPLRKLNRSLRLHPSDFLSETLIKYVFFPSLKIIRRWNKLPEWSRLFTELLKEDSFILIVLDACRYDAFSCVQNKFLHGELIATQSLGPNTYSWLHKMFACSEFRDLRLFYARLSVKTHDIRLVDFIAPNRNVEVIEVWPYKAKALGTVLPEEVNEKVIRRGLNKRNIIWYMQPHYPWIRHRELSLKLVNEVTWQDFTPKDLVREGLKHKGIDRREIIRAYLDNLETVLKAVSILVEEVKKNFTRRIVITADHGELLGEYGLYLHPHYELPQLYIVPWLEVEGVV